MKKFRPVFFFAILIAAIGFLLPHFQLPAISVSTTVNGRELPIYCVETEKPQIALSFDAAWGNEDTQNILDILAKHDVKVTFFMTGGWVETYPEDVKVISDIMYSDKWHIICTS